MKLTKEEKSWIMYDCGNSAYSIAVTTALLPIVFGMFGNVSSMDLGYFNSFAGIIVAVLSPILGTIADYKEKKKRFFLFFAILGIVMTMALAFVSPESGQWQILIAIFILSVVGFNGSLIFYDAFISDITENERMDMVSSKGFAFGYIFSVIPFGISLLLILLLGMDNALGYQIGFIITALWWGLFTIPMMRNVNQKYYIEPEPKPVRNSFKRLYATFRNILQYKYVFLFLLAYFFYIDGVDTIIRMVVPYATSILGADAMSTFTLLGILLIIQIVAFPCAILYGNLAKKHSARKMIIVGIITYIIACIGAFYVQTIWHIFILGMLIGSAQGGIQALSRSYYAKIIPKEKSNEFFGFYNVFGKFSAIIGPAIMAFTSSMTGSARLSILSIIPLFVIGFVIYITLPAGLDQPEQVVERGEICLKTITREEN